MESRLPKGLIQLYILFLNAFCIFLLGNKFFCPRSNGSGERKHEKSEYLFRCLSRDTALFKYPNDNTVFNVALRTWNMFFQCANLCLRKDVCGDRMYDLKMVFLSVECGIDCDQSCDNETDMVTEAMGVQIPFT